MATNLYFNQKVRSEQILYEDIVIESLKMYGQDVYYLPRDLVNEDKILGEDVPSRFNSSYKVEMYIENTEGFDGEGDLFTKFGVEIRDQATFVISRRRWAHTVKRFDNELSSVRPLEGDVIYLPLSNSLFQIMAVEHEQPFYQLSNLPVFKLRCELFEYGGEDIDTGVQVIDDIADKHAFEYRLLIDSASKGWDIGDTITQTLSTGVIMSGEISYRNDSDLTLGVIHSGANDGLYHTWVSGRPVYSDSSVANVVTVTENNQLSENEKNTFFDTTQTDLGFLDFSESNPFGDPR
jgi:hypothetical protein